jgi:hypothetical protein
MNNEDSISNLLKKIKKLKENYSPKELKSIISYMENPINQLIAKKLLLSDPSEILGESNQLNYNYKKQKQKEMT